MARNNLSFHAVKCLPEIFSVGSNIQQGSVSGLERDAHNDLKRLPTPQKYDDIVVCPYVTLFLINSCTAPCGSVITWKTREFQRSLSSKAVVEV